MVAQILTLQAVYRLVHFYIHLGPLLMNDVSEDRVFFAFLDVVVFSKIGEFIARLLPGHALLYPFFATPMLLPSLAGALKPTGEIGHFLHPLIAHLRQPQLDRLGFGLGTNCTSRSNVSAVATSVSRSLPSSAVIFNR